MMRSWTKILPYFIVAWLARRNCERYDIHGWQWAGPYRDCLIRIPKPINAAPESQGQEGGA